MKKLLFVSTALVAAAGAASAQETRASGSELGEVVVTATRRAETVMTVPISVTALDPETLDRQGVRDINDLAKLAPGISLVPSGYGGVKVAIRGITSLAGASTTGVYVDDTPIQARTFATVYPAIFDLERVEVLRGPQGTLFGAGSQGGTLRFITPQPSLDTYSAYARGEVGLTAHGQPNHEVGVAVGGPIIEGKLGFRASLWTRHDGGYVDRVSFYTGELYDRNSNSTDSYVGRLAFAWAPTENLKITPAVMFQRVNQDDADTIWRDAGSYRSFFDIPSPIEEEFVLPSVTVDYDFGSFAFKSITSYYARTQDRTYRFFHSFAQGCPPGGQAPGYPADRCGLFYPQIPNYTLAYHQDLEQRNWSQEFRLTSTNDSRFSWVIGGFYYNSTQRDYEDEDEPLLDQLTQLLFKMSARDFAGVGIGLIDGRYAFIYDGEVRDKELAAFGDFTYAITDRLKATLGLRYSKTSFSFDERSDGLFGATGSGPLVASGKATEKPFTPKFNIAYNLDDGLIYGTVAKGYRVGGANAILPGFCAAQLASLGINGAPPPYKSDTVWSYELGAKKRLLNRSVEVAGSVYQIDWDAIQGNIPLNSCSYSFVGNFGKARVRGFDLQMQANPIPGLVLGGTVAYNDGKYTETIPQPNSTTLLAKDGAPIPFSPKWQLTASAEYTWAVRDNLNAYVRADYRYTGEYVRNNPPGVIGFLAASRNGAAVDDVSLRAGVTRDRTDVSVFVKNLFDNDTALNQTYSTRLGTYGSRAERYTIQRPRTVGVTATYRY